MLMQFLRATSATFSHSCISNIIATELSQGSHGNLKVDFFFSIP